MATIAELVREAYSHWDDAAVLSRTGRELHDRNRLDTSREVLARALELNPGDVEAWASYAYAHLRGFMPGKGLDVLRKGIESTGSDQLRGALAGFTSDEEERKALCEQLEGSDDPAVRGDLASARMWAGDDAAYRELKELRRKHPDNARVRETWLWVAFASGGKAGGEEIDIVGAAIPVVDEKIAEEPDRISGRWMKAQLLHQSKEWDALLEATGEALERFPDEETMMFLRGRAYREKGDLPHAVQCFTRAIGMKPSFVGARVELGRTYEAQGEFGLAEEIFSEIPRANPAYPGGLTSLALFFGRRERWDEAETLFLENWPRLEPWQQARLKQQPEVAAMLERDRVRAAMGEQDAG